MMKKRLMVLAFAGVLAVGLSSCGKKEVSSNHVQSVTSETGAETSISEGETPDLSEEQPEQVELPESEGSAGRYITKYRGYTDSGTGTGSNSGQQQPGTGTECTR